MLKKVNHIKKPELMLPIKNWSSLEACKNYADAVYFSIDKLSMRAGLDSINLRNLSSFIKKCHRNNIKAYLTINCVLYNNDLKTAQEIINKAKKVEVDAVIVWDMAAIYLARKAKMSFIISTQANISNYEAALQYEKMGAYRVVLAREMTLKHIKELKKRVGKLEVETFIHGAMCYSISGRCLFSSALTGASANCGACTQPCRQAWTLTNEYGKQIVSEGKYFMSAKDMCMIEHVPELIEAGIDSFKIEGRKRDPHYVEVTAKCYRQAIDSYFDKTINASKIKDWRDQLTKVYNRGFNTGFYFGTPTKAGITLDQADNLSPVKKIILGEVKHYFSRIGVAEVYFGHQGVEKGEEVVIEGSKTYLKMVVGSIEINKQTKTEVKKGENAGLKVNERVREGDKVFLYRER